MRASLVGDANEKHVVVVFDHDGLPGDGTLYPDILESQLRVGNGNAGRLVAQSARVAAEITWPPDPDQRWVNAGTIAEHVDLVRRHAPPSLHPTSPAKK